MNDPGLDEPATEAAQDVNNRVHAEDDQAEQEEREYLDPINGGLRPQRAPS
ncbi:hypothetical protein AA0117_g11801 [Alternaria alternata]|uniref:Uncharacterized protein n=3 Tax=Alternaria sect. Alternaria TaxID=2499237 RepID=A0A4Q4N294_ALTAL|nr:hypothetical protein AG0111_0g4416 [Alternaria gaisen]RYN20438.1 hypothetical protein AA0115_g10293 [Alternaria tenuissima]RYN66674.1 hypothetical protein AA0117_g11801 [Alternaria alternata]RYN26825.1 hypothetical protein AA0114_g12601 [Alternaria tenuissima]RYN56131.1 hypothetical protein AA0118_g8305 [Alternaria tenuissima]